MPNYSARERDGVAAATLTVKINQALRKEVLMGPNSLEELLKKLPALADYMKAHPLMRDLSEDYPRAEVDAMQVSMREGASHFLDSELEALSGVIRLTVEFFHRLQRVDIDSVDAESLRYWGGSVFAGIDSFMLVCQAYRTTAGQIRSTLLQRVTSRAVLKEEFVAVYGELAAETNFEKRCRLLLDLFKLQIIFAGMTCD
jgi:hypothetical protein